MKIIQSILLICSFAVFSATAFAPSMTARTTTTTTTTTTRESTSLAMSDNEEDLLRWARQSRSASSDDNVVELLRPLGLVLQEDENRNVFVETVAPRGNAARTGQVKEGDIVTMCSATFGDQMWSTRGVGLTRVLAAIRVRAGPTVKLVFETPSQYQKKAKMTTSQRKAMEDAKIAAQAKKDRLLDELEESEQKIKKGKFLGLF